eukprot:SAG31_NODE_7273_length_1737_cov_0.961538_1_plen_85_part_00
MADTEPAPEAAAAAAELVDCARYGEEEEVQQVRVLPAPPGSANQQAAGRRCKRVAGGGLLSELAIPVDIAQCTRKKDSPAHQPP